jgi:outer membrane protein assembly factor BamB
MIMTRTTISTCILALCLVGSATSAHDWTDWRGPLRDGHSSETGLPASWSPDGDNLAWRAPYGGRSTPIVLGDRVYLQNGAGEGADLQERIMCFDADTGEVLWERRINLFMSDVPPHRVGWASPVGDPATGNVYVYTVGGSLLGFSSGGELLWERSLAEDFGLITTHGGRTASPVIEGDLVIVSGLSSGWGEQARGSQRFFAFDKSTGHTRWVSSPGGRPYDTTYAPPYVTEVGGVRLLITGGGDGAVHAIKPQTGEPVWRFEYSKRGINTGAILKDGIAVVTQGEENLNTSEMGLVAAIDATATGDLDVDDAKWSVGGILAGYSSPVLDGDRFYVVDNSANLLAFDFATGDELWTLNLGTIQRASPVLADGKLYVGTVNGTFFIIDPGEDGAEILDRDELGNSESGEEFEEIYASVAISDGRVYLATAQALYAIGGERRPSDAAASTSAAASGSAGEPAWLQVAPTELVLAPGESIELDARLYDQAGRFVREADAAWSLDGLEGTVSDGRFTVAADAAGHAGKVTATVGDLAGAARIRVVPPLPWSEDFESMTALPEQWINATGKFELREMDGTKVLAKKADNPFLRRARVYLGPSDWSDYTVQVDAKATTERRQMGVVGVVAQRYQLSLLGSHQRIELQSWHPETERTDQLRYRWEADKWYRLKLEVDTLDDGTVRARGKVWPRDEDEPAEWQVERRDENPNRQGSAGIYADATPTEVYFDNLKVVANE